MLPNTIKSLQNNNKDSRKNQLQVENDIIQIHEWLDDRVKHLNWLQKWIENDGPERILLDEFLDIAGFEKDTKTRYIAFRRIADMNEAPLKNFLETSEYTQAQKNQILTRINDFVTRYHMAIHSELLEKINTQWLLTPFYRQILDGTHRVGFAFNALYRAWNSYLIFGINQELEKKFDGNQEAVMEYLAENNLFDKWHGWEIADRSYSVLKESGAWYKKLPYRLAFSAEVAGIIRELDTFVASLEELEDTVYWQKRAYINYLNALILAFSETDTDRLVEKWAWVDVAWMAVQSPFQIGHPMEYYEDSYRKAVAPEWDLRLKDSHLFDSQIRGDVVSMFEKIASEKGISKDSELYSFSLRSLQNAQLYISGPMIYYGSWISGLPSAQVVPNDTIVSREHGKKIFSFAEEGLMQDRALPKTKLTRVALDEKFRKKSDELLHWPEEIYYRVYDVSTIGHEFGHTLWLEPDTETKMNTSGNFKNIEEWKATAGWLIAFFMNPREDICESVVVELAERAVRFIARMKMDELAPYYCEGLIHLKILFDSGMLALNWDGKILMNYTLETFEALKKGYIEQYSILADTYIAKKDAKEFLYRFAEVEGKYYLPKDELVRAVVEWYYELFQKFGNTLDDWKES